MNRINKVTLFVLASEIAGNIGMIFAITAIPNWYSGLVKPSFNPPNWLFGPVWITLFALMGISAFLVLEQGTGRRDARIALSVFCLQFVLNALCNYLFFGLYGISYGLVDTILLWGTIAANIFLFYRVSRATGFLLFPYIFWVTITICVKRDAVLRHQWIDAL